jgi:hypothetical protein
VADVARRDRRRRRSRTGCEQHHRPSGAGREERAGCTGAHPPHVLRDRLIRAFLHRPPMLANFRLTIIG